MSSRYKQHKTDFEVVPPERPLALPCQVRGCHCLAYEYVPRVGPNPVRCRCKHSPQDHSEATGHMCKKCESEISAFKDNSISLFSKLAHTQVSHTCFQFSGSSCSGFQSSYTCGCGQPSSAHQTLVCLVNRPLLDIAIQYAHKHIVARLT